MQREQEPLQANRSPSIEHGTAMTKPKVWRDNEASTFSLSSNDYQMMDHGNFVTQSWLSDVGWDAMVTNGPWANTTTSTSYPHPVIGNEDILYSAFESQYGGHHAPNYNSARGQYLPIKTHYSSINGPVNQHHESFNNSHDVSYGDMSFPQSMQYTQFDRYEEFDRDNQTSSSVAQLSPHQLVFPETQFVDLVVPKRESRSQTPRWSVSVPSSEPPLESFVFVNTFTDSNFSEAPTSAVKLNWSPTAAEEQSLSADSSLPYREPVTKRKLESSPSTSSNISSPPHQNMSDFVVVFENAPGALASVKKRKKLEAPVRKAAKDVRRAGACHQCRFRKRTVSLRSFQHCYI